MDIAGIVHRTLDIHMHRCPQIFLHAQCGRGRGAQDSSAYLFDVSVCFVDANDISDYAKAESARCADE